MSFGGVKADDPASNHLGWVYIIFGFIMALGAFFAWAYVPDVQDKRDGEGSLKLPSKTLEDLGKGLRKAEEDGQVIGFRNTFGSRYGRRNKTGSIPND